MKLKFIMLSIVLINVGVYSQKSQIKDAQSLFEKGKSEEAIVILKKTEYLILNAPDEEKSDFYFLKGNVLKDLAVKNIDAANNFSDASQSYQDVILYENESGKYKFSVKANLALKDMKSKLVNGASQDFKAGNFKESAEKSYKVYLFDKKDTLNLYNAAAAYLNAKEYGSAIQYYEQLKKMNYSGNGIIYYATNKKTKEEDAFISPKARESYIQEGLYEKPRNEAIPSRKFDVNKNLAYAYLERRDFIKAEAVYNYLIELNPNFIDSYINLAYLKLQSKKEITDKIDALGNSKKEMLEYDKLTAKKDDITRSAIPYLQKALSIEPKNPEVTKTLLGIYRSLDMTKEYNSLKAMSN
jgi:tetratricopeptide (TPR) repeat protein